MESKSIKNIMQAIQNVQQKAGTIKKTTKGQVGSRQYKYANLNDTWESIKQLLKDNGLVVVQTPTTGESSMGQFFKTTIYHIESGESITETMMMVLQRDDPQGIGAAITYYRRYMTTSMLGLIPDDDNDAREHRLATAEQKLKIVGAVKIVFPEAKKPVEINEVLANILGKHPSKIREDEAEGAITLIQAFKDKEDSDNE